MAYEPGGGSGEPYDRYEDLSFSPGYSIQDWIRNLMQQGNVGVAPPIGTGMPDFPQDPMYGREPPSDLQMEPRSEADPDEFIQQQLAGDVVPMRGIVRPQDTEEFNTRMGRVNANPYMGSRGMQSIEKFGGKQGPYLDLMDILMMNRR